MNEFDPQSLAWEKADGLIPAVVQDCHTGQVLMLGYMSRQALDLTLSSRKVTFFSRTRQALWTKGETSGNTLVLEEIACDCDRDALLVLARPLGPTCHRGTRSCFSEDDKHRALEVLGELDRLIRRRKQERPEGSYTSRLFREGEAAIAQKLGEEAVETVVSAMQPPERTIEEAADLLYHLFVFLASRGLSIADVAQELSRRRSSQS